MGVVQPSREAQRLAERLRKVSGIPVNLWLRAAFCYSLSLDGNPDSSVADGEGGTEQNAERFFGRDQHVLLSLLRESLQTAPEEAERRSFLKRHVERGLRAFAAILARYENRGEKLLLELASLADSWIDIESSRGDGLLASARTSKSHRICMSLGKHLRTDQLAEFCLNGPGDSPHVAIMGRNGTGKTRALLRLLENVSDSSVPFVLFDFSKGDIAGNVDFVSRCNATVLRLPEDRIPIHPLDFRSSDVNEVKLAQRRFRDTIGAVHRLGPKQKSCCSRLLADSQYEAESPCTFAELLDHARRHYEANSIAPDSLLSCFEELAAFNVFDETVFNDKQLFSRSHIIDVHRLPVESRKLVVFLVLDWIYSHAMKLSEASLDSAGNREMRFIVGIDEAHHYLQCRQPTLEHLVREVRSKGVGVWLASQSPDDFDQPKYNFSREMGLSIVFSCAVDHPRLVESLLGGKVSTQKLSRLDSGIAMISARGGVNPSEIEVWSANS